MSMSYAVMQPLLTFLLTVFCLCVIRVSAYGRLLEPPSRGSLWRFGYDAPVNKEDDRNDCGGADRLWHINGGNCGMCGDAYDLPVPRPHEIGGLYGKGLITRSYLPGVYIDVEVNFTHHAGGYFQFSICKIEDFVTGTSQEIVNGTAYRRRRGYKPIKCKARRPLDIEETDEPLYTIDNPQDHLHLRVKLPRRYQCQWCVIIWEYWTGSPCGFHQDCNSPQGQFKACSDVSILADREKAKYKIAQAMTTASTSTPTKSPNVGSSDTNDGTDGSNTIAYHFKKLKKYVMNELRPSL